VNQQNALLEKLTVERNDKDLSRRVQKDRVLLEAESHLRQAIKILMESNEAVKGAL
jgi:hypothetical protein